MSKINVDDIYSENPHLDRESLEALRKYLKEIRPGGRPRYRLAPVGTHRATIGAPDVATQKPRRVRNYPGF